jgi:hypothetical protein
MRGGAPAPEEGPWRLRVDIMTTRSLLWVARAREPRDLSSEIHLYLFDRYSRLAWYHARRGHRQRALHLRARAAEHWRHTDHDGPPFAVAHAMPVPRPSVLTWAVATRRIRGRDDAA